MIVMENRLVCLISVVIAMLSVSSVQAQTPRLESYADNFASQVILEGETGPVAAVIGSPEPTSSATLDVRAISDFGISRISAIASNPYAALGGIEALQAAVSSDFFDVITINSPLVVSGFATATLRLTGTISYRFENPLYNPTGIERFYPLGYLRSLPYLRLDSDLGNDQAKMSDVSIRFVSFLEGSSFAVDSYLRNFTDELVVASPLLTGIDDEPLPLDTLFSENDFIVVTGVEALNVNQQFFTFSSVIDEEMRISFPFQTGVPVGLRFYQYCEFTISGGDVACDFGNTAELTGFEVFDADFQPVTSFAVLSAAVARDVARGYAPPLATVPEPQQWLQLLVGFGFVGAMLRRRNGRTVAVRTA
jgi:hypothetical protein